MIDVPVLVKDALREGNTTKFYRFVVYEPDGETVDFHIENDTLVSETVSFDERMCSDTNLKFGLCEGTSLEFQAFNIPNITGRRLKATVVVSHDYSVTGTLENNQRVTIEYGGRYRIFNNDHNTGFTLSITSPGGASMVVSVPADPSKTYTEYYTDLGAGDSITIRSSSYSLQYESHGETGESIPMGYFTVSECSRQTSTGILKVTAYNKLKSEYLDAKANDEVLSLASQGELGISGSISYYKLLEELLEEYKIKPLNKHTVAVTQDSHITSTNTRRVDTYRLNTQTMQIAYDGEFLQPNEYYNLRVNMRGAFEAIAEGLDYRNTYVTVDDETMSLYDYCFSDYDQHQYFGGVIQILVNQSSVLFQGFADFIRDTGKSIFETGYITSTNYYTQILVTLPLTDFDQYFAMCDMELDHLELSDIEKLRVDTTMAESFADVTIRDLQSSVFETMCQFGKLSRTTDLFSGVELNHGRLFPAETLYPANDLYPLSSTGDGQAELVERSMYSKLWADEGNVRVFRYLIITYKGTEEDPDTHEITEVEKKLQRTVNENGTDDYNMSNNWLFKNLVWSDEDIGDYADAMVAKMRDVSWFPFELWCAGLPYIETGDEVEISTAGNTYTSYVLRRNLKGIQNLQDEMINGTLDIF